MISISKTGSMGGQYTSWSMRMIGFLMAALPQAQSSASIAGISPFGTRTSALPLKAFPSSTAQTP